MLCSRCSTASRRRGAPSAPGADSVTTDQQIRLGVAPVSKHRDRGAFTFMNLDALAARGNRRRIVPAHSLGELGLQIGAVDDGIGHSVLLDRTRAL